MNVDLVKHKVLITVALGASVIGAAGLLFYQQFQIERKRRLIQKELDQLSMSVQQIRSDLDDVKSVLESNNQVAAFKTKDMYQYIARSVTTDADSEMFSTMDDEPDLCDELFGESDKGLCGVKAECELSFSELDLLLDANNKEDKTKAYGLLIEILDKGEDQNDDVLWRLAKASHMLSSIYGAEGDNEKKKEFILKGVDFGEKAVSFNESNWRAHKWYAICVGARGQLQGAKEKLHDGRIFKEHIDKALAINAEDPLLHHLLGRFFYEIAALSWIERKVANALFGEVPKGSYKDAIDSLMKAEGLYTTPWKENRLLISKCYAALQDYKQTLQWLDSAKEAPTSSTEDEKAEKEVNDLLEKYRSYRNRQP